MMTPHELGLFLGAAGGALVGVGIPIATLRAWFARVGPPPAQGSPSAHWPVDEVTRIVQRDLKPGNPSGRPPTPAPRVAHPVVVSPLVVPSVHVHPTRAARAALPVVAPVPAPDLGADARARAREVRDAVASLGWPIPRATWATEAALAKLGGGCPDLESWIPSALRELAPAAKAVPSLGTVRRR
jgi:hypothetical protein